MSKIQIKRLASEHTIEDATSTILEIGQPFFDQNNSDLYVGDGVNTIGQLSPIAKGSVMRAMQFDDDSHRIRIKATGGLYVSNGKIETLNLDVTNTATIANLNVIRTYFYSIC